MNTTVKEIESKMQFWSLVGPLVVGCILLIILVRSSVSILMPAAAVAGVFVCYKLKWRGLLLSLGVLAAIYITQLSFYTTNDWLWLTVLTLSIASAFVVTLFAFDHSADSLSELDDQSERYKETITQLDDRLRIFQEKWAQERQDFLNDLLKQKGILEERDAQTRSAQKSAFIAQEELTAYQNQHQGLVQELFEARQHADHLEQQIAAFDQQRSTPGMMQLEESYTELCDRNNEMIAKYEYEISALKGVLEESERQRSICLQELQLQAGELASMREMHDLAAQSSVSVDEQQLVQRAIVQELNDHIDNLTREKQLLECTLVRLQGEFETLRDHDSNQAQVLESNRETILRLQATLDAKEATLKSETSNAQLFKSNSEIRERQLVLQVEELSRKWAGVSNQIGDWQRKLEDYSVLSDKATKLQQQSEQLAQDKQAMEADVQTMRLRIMELEQAYESASKQVHQVEASNPDEKDREIRRLTGLYNQLKEQFMEKSAVLNKTRKDLFHTQEELQALKRDSVECQVYGDYETSRELSRMLAEAESERNHMVQEYQNEVEQLQSVLGAFIGSRQ